MPKDVWNIKYGTDQTLRDYGDRGWVGGPLKEYNPALDLNKPYRLAMNEYLERNQPKSYSEHDIIPSEYPYADIAQTTPYKPTELPLHIGPYKKHSGSASTEPTYKTVGLEKYEGILDLDRRSLTDTWAQEDLTDFSGVYDDEKGTIVPDKGIMHAGILPPQLLAWMHPKNLAKIWAKQAQTNLALETGGKFVEKIKQERIKKKQEAEARAALQARVTAQANREAARRVARGEGRDYGHTETRASSGWRSSPFYQGGRVGFSKGGIVDLWQELSNL